VEIENTTGRNFKDLEGMLGNATGIEKEQLGMQRNPYWPLNGPSFFSTTEIPSQCISLTVPVAQRLRAQISGADGKPT
jgi:hypothetical protein